MIKSLGRTSFSVFGGPLFISLAPLFFLPWHVGLIGHNRHCCQFFQRISVVTKRNSAKPQTYQMSKIVKTNIAEFKFFFSGDSFHWETHSPPMSLFLSSRAASTPSCRASAAISAPPRRSAMMAAMTSPDVVTWSSHRWWRQRRRLTPSRSRDNETIISTGIKALCWRLSSNADEN